MKKILVTGANGFVGRFACEALQKAGASVIGGIRSDHSAADLPSGVQPLIIPEIGPRTDWAGKLSGVEAIVHLASRVHVMSDPAGDPMAAYREVNVAGTSRLAEMAAEAGVARLVFLSSVKVNGEGALYPYKETDAPAPCDPYGQSKWEAEQALHQASRRTGLEVVILRPPLVYGPGVKANFLSLLRMVEKGIPLPLASLSNLRSFLYVGNLAEAIVLCTFHQRAAGRIFLVSDGEDISTPELIRKMAAALGRPANLFPFPPKLLQIGAKLMGKSAVVERLLGSLTVDCSLARETLGWRPLFTLETGLRETANWFQVRKPGEFT